MCLFNFNKSAKNNTFNYIPRYYNEEKEEREQRMKQYEETDDPDAVKNRIRSGLRHSYRGDSQFRKSQVNKSNIRLLYIIAILILLSLLMLRSDYFLKILQAISPDG